MKTRLVCCIIACALPTMAAEPAKPAVFREVCKLTNKLASIAGFSDDDAIEVAVLFLGNLLGPKSAKEKLTTRVVTSKPEWITVFAGYDNGITTQGFRFHFERGDIAQNRRYARLLKLELVPDE